MVHLNYGRQNNVYKLTTIFVCVHQCVRGGGRECTDVTNISCIAQVTWKFINYTLLVNSGWLHFSNFKVFVEFSADEHRLNGGPDF